MKFSTTVGYGTRALIQLAAAYPDRAVSVREVGQQEEVYERLVGSLAPVDCVDCPASCSMQDTCPTRDTWVEVKEAVAMVLERTTIQDLLD